MGLLDAILPKRYKNSRTLYEEDLDAWRQKTEDYLNTVNLNLQQLGIDAFGSDYEFNNDGYATEPVTLEQYIYNIIDGTQPIDGTSSDTFIINSDGNASTLTTASMTAPRTHTLPDNSGTFITDTSLKYFIPIGTILLFDDFNGTLALPSTTAYWHPCNGTIINSPASLLNGKTPLDFTGRAIVGFTTGVEGDASINTAGSCGVVGNASHQIDIAHTHGALGTTSKTSGNESADHTHTGPSHTHTGPSHTHGPGSLYFQIGESIVTTGPPNHVEIKIGAGINHTASILTQEDLVGSGTDYQGVSTTTYPGTNDLYSYANTGGGVTDAAGTGATGSAGTGVTGGVSNTHTHTTDINHTHASGLSATQNILPRSVQIRAYVRIL
jgi:hypothetical protein